MTDYVANNGLRIDVSRFERAHRDWVRWYDAQIALSKQWANWIKSDGPPPEDACRDPTLELVDRLARVRALPMSALEGYVTVLSGQWDGGDPWWADCDWRDSAALLHRIIYKLACCRKLRRLREINRKNQ